MWSLLSGTQSGEVADAWLHLGSIQCSPFLLPKTSTSVITKDFSGREHLVRPKFPEHYENLWSQLNKEPKCSEAVNQLQLSGHCGKTPEC